MKTRVLSTVLAVAFSFIPGHAQKTGSITYSNPLTFTYESQGKTCIELRDPCIIHDGDTYYAIFTMWPFRNYTDVKPLEPDLGSSPGIRMYSTRDFKTWKDEGFVVKSSELPADCPYKYQFWAP
jgi:xylan 1,4-beta-xylosidase